MKILLVDDDALVRSGIQTIIEMETKSWEEPFRVIGQAANGHEGVALFFDHQPDIVLMDIRMPEMDGIQAGQEILTRCPQASITYLTTFQEDDYIIQALKIGAKGYILKTDFKSLVPAIKAVSLGQRVFGDEIVAKLPQYISQATRSSQAADHPPLNDKEIELIYCVAQGLNNKEIAEVLHFSEGTIRNYLSSLLEKLNLRDRTQLAIYYYKHLQR